MSNINHALAAASILVAAAGALASDATEVPRGGAEICTDAGSGQVVLKLKNTTGEAAEDVTISVINKEGNAVPNITEVDVLGTDKDHVDDNGDGDLGTGDDADSNEADTTDSSPGATCKSILSGATVAKNGTVDVTVKLSDNLPAGTCFRVKFSTKIGDTHYDLCSLLPLDPGAPFVATTLDYGAAQVAPALVVDDPSLGIQVIQLFTTPDNPVVDVKLPDPYVPFVTFEGGACIVQIDPPLPGAQAHDLGITLAHSIDYPFNIQPLDIQAILVPIEPACPADFNADGVLNMLDYFAFRAAWAQKDPAADLNGDGLFTFADYLIFRQLYAQGCP